MPFFEGGKASAAQQPAKPTLVKSQFHPSKSSIAVVTHASLLSMELAPLAKRFREGAPQKSARTPRTKTGKSVKIGSVVCPLGRNVGLGNGGRDRRRRGSCACEGHASPTLLQSLTSSLSFNSSVLHRS